MRLPAVSWRTALVALAAVALAVRLGAMAATPDLRLASDPSDYARHGRSIAAGHGYPPSHVAPRRGPSAIRPPVYPLVVAGVFKVTGNSVTAARVAQAAIGALAVVLVALVALDVWGPAVALVAGALAAIFPPLVIDGMTLLSEPLFVVLELGALLAVLRWRRSRRMALLLTAGGLAGLALLTRANGALLLLPLLLAAKAGSGWRSPRAYREAAVLLLCALAVVTPWTIRNAVVLDAFIPIADQDGYTIAATYNATSRAHDAIWRVPTADPALARLIAANRDLDEAQLDAKLRTAARRFALDHPGYLATVAVKNTPRMFNLGGDSYERAVAAGDYGLGPNWAKLMTFGLLPFLALALAGVLVVDARRAPGWFWAVPVLMLAPIMVLAQNRARAPVDPFILLLAALALVNAARRLRRTRARPRAGPASSRPA